MQLTVEHLIKTARTAAARHRQVMDAAKAVAAQVQAQTGQGQPPATGADGGAP